MHSARRILERGIAIALLLATHAATAQAPAAATTTASPNDYSKPDTWLCRAGREDACTVDLTTTIVAANGKLTREPYKANANAPIDCFYVYPTVSLDTTGNSDMNIGPEEKNVILQQFARFGSTCRQYAPLYRQITLTALRAMISGKPLEADRALAYKDVVDAWNYYLEHDNKGRGVVLIGHSQGSGLLTRLIAEQIEGKPVQARVISSLLLGTNVAVPKGKEVGGSFKSTPVCKSASEIGCVISYVSFRDTIPPPSNTRFGRVPGEGHVAVCTNPAALAGGKGELHAYLNATGRTITSPDRPTEWAKGATVATPFVSVPGLLEGECLSNDRGTYLQVTTKENPADARTDEIAGDVVANGKISEDWGLHLIDVNVAMGNLVDIVAQQSKTYLAKHK
jgi:Protein of unknown function (DUF3089)